MSRAGFAAAVVAVLANMSVDILGVTVLPGGAWALALVGGCGAVAFSTVIWAGIWSKAPDA